MVKFKKLPRLLVSAAVLIMLVLLIARPQIYMKSVSGGLTLFAVSVLPAMFPFFFFSSILTGLGAAEELGKLLNKPVKKLFMAPPIGGYIFAMSVLCGYPIGAKLVADCVSSGICTKENANTLIAFTSTSGPLFVLGTIGSAVLGNYTAGVIILVVHYASAVINGLVFRRAGGEDFGLSAVTNSSPDNVLSEAVYGSIKSILAVGAFIIIFNMVIDGFYDVGIMSAFESGERALGVSSEVAKGAFCGFVEVTRGAVVLGASGAEFKTVIPLLAFSVSFGGLSVIFQSSAFLSKVGVKISRVIITKASQAIIAYFLATLICAFI